ncbi:hypothetical protein [Marinibacterium profundimaris]|uniref:Glyceraldehyde-3-phosphate dehydrogenase n=1 Tax=Marinibacterium profundimaris TaxID=1679460 RepID=A0A225NLW1_9RHOB|nr:hypothetical protein [Marinibacterium profundimaris]OWU75057.1 glyceraldehyde-3-phosphate dehydrogenase [Marinibacterium profundimaris]
MTDRLALFLGIVIVSAVTADVAFYGTEHIVFLGKKLYNLIEWMAFWR